MEIYQNNWRFEQIYSYRTLIYYGKTMVLWELYGTIPKTMELWFTMEKKWYFGKNYGTIVNYS